MQIKKYVETLLILGYVHKKTKSSLVISKFGWFESGTNHYLYKYSLSYVKGTFFLRLFPSKWSW